MKISRPILRQSTATQAATAKGKAEKTEKAEASSRVDEVDRFESGEQQGGQSQGEKPEEDAELVAAFLENPKAFRQSEWYGMIGTDSLSPNVESAFQGIVSLVDPDKE